MVERKRLSPALLRHPRRRQAKPATRKHFTEANVLILPIQKKPYRVWDAGTGAARGLQILVQPSGTKTYRVYYGSGKALKLGRVGEMTLEDARTEARINRGLASKGLDPRQHDPRHAGTFGELLEIWNKDDQIGRLENISADRTLTLMKSSCAHWLGRPVASINHKAIEDLLHNKRDVAPYMANRLHGHLRTFFRWAIRTHKLNINPMAEMLKPWAGAKPRNAAWFKKEAADKVIRDLWLFADKCRSDDGKFIKLLLITGKRKTVVLEMRWDEIDDDWNWTPPAGSKTKRNHPIPLTRLAQTVLKTNTRSRPIPKSETQYLPIDPNSPKELREFQATIGAPPKVLSKARDRELLEEVRTAINLPDFFWHGVRHIVETKLAELGIPADTRDMLLDHSPVRGAGKGYDHHEYRDEKLKALDKWCGHIMKQVDPKGAKIFK